MSKATNRIIQDEVSEARENIGITTIIAVGVSTYDYLNNLRGPSKDLEIINQLFVEDQDSSLYSVDQLVIVEDPTSAELRQKIIEFAETRSARGDIVIFYFSGHGSVLGGGEFLLCTKDTKINELVEGGGVLSASAVLFRDIVHSFSSVDIRPVFIIDACFSGTVGLAEDFQIGQMIQNEVYIFGNNAGLLCSSSPEAASKDTAEGGIFTLCLKEVIENGIETGFFRNKPLLTLKDIASPLADCLARDGYPLPRLFFGPQLPQIAISKHTKFDPESENFVPYMRKIIELLWNAGEPIEQNISDFLKTIGPGAYANHSKLSRPPWGLLEDGQSGSHRILTERGIQFAQGTLPIPKRIIKDPETWDWVADPDADMVYIQDIGD